MAQTVHLTLELTNAGKIDGESTVSSLDRADTIECSSFQYALTTPREAASGALTGRRMHAPVTINKRVDKATPLLLKALCENDMVTNATFKFYRPAVGGEGSEEHFFSVKLEKGYISKVNQLSEDAIMAGEAAPPMMEEVSFVFQNITWTYELGGVEHTDTWSGEA